MKDIEYIYSQHMKTTHKRRRKGSCEGIPFIFLSGPLLEGLATVMVSASVKEGEGIVERVRCGRSVVVILFS